MKLEAQSGQNNPLEEMAGKLSHCRNKIVSLDISNWCDKVTSPEFRDFLLKLQCNTDTVIYTFRVPYLERSVLDSIETAIADVMRVSTVSFTPLTSAELQTISEELLQDKGFTATGEAWEQFQRRLAEEKSDGRFYGIRTAMNIVDDLVQYGFVRGKPYFGILVRTVTTSVAEYYNWVPGGNTNDLYMGQRIYTDANHDFETFLEEAYCERNPLSESYFKIIETGSTFAAYHGYDSLRGIYNIGIGGATGFNSPYYSDPNKHYRANFFVRGDDHDRKIYAMTSHSSGQLECAVLLDADDVMLPVSMEVGKNFSESGGERNLYNLADNPYSETIFPLVVNSGEKYEYTVLNLYQNWGNFPLKQISWIQFFSPYYHLSTGVTETNCILPWTFTNQIWYNTLPDFRGMSAPLW
jgi:hypothetical protein